MKNNKCLRSGFTLIELLVVIAIIGILSSVVLVSLNVARGKGADAKVKAQLANARASAEIYFDKNGYYNDTVTVGGDVDGTILGCLTVNTMFQDVDSGMIQYTDAANNYPGATTIKCTSTATEYAISASLHDAGEFWCVDSTGVSRSTDALQADSTYVCL